MTLLLINNLTEPVLKFVPTVSGGEFCVHGLDWIFSFMLNHVLSPKDKAFGVAHRGPWKKVPLNGNAREDCEKTAFWKTKKYYQKQGKSHISIYLIFPSRFARLYCSCPFHFVQVHGVWESCVFLCVRVMLLIDLQYQKTFKRLQRADSSSKTTIFEPGKGEKIVPN